MIKLSKSCFVFLLFWGITLLLYAPTIYSKFVFDFVDLIYDFRNKGWGDLGSFSTGFSPYLFAKAIFFAVFELFGFNAWVWYALSCWLHALNAFLLFSLSSVLLKQVSYSKSFKAAFFGALIFLVSPYATEVVVWSGALNYLIVTLFILVYLNGIAWYFDKKQKVHLVGSSLSLVSAVFSHELGLFLLPGGWLLMIFLVEDYRMLLHKKYIWPFIFPLLIVTFYFINQLLNGHLVGHYGVETHLNFRIDEMVIAFYRYMLKILFLFTFFSISIQEKVYGFIQQHFILIPLLLVLVGSLIFLAFAVSKHRGILRVPAFFLLLGFIFLFPVLNLYFPYWIPIHADRYCYLPSAFVYSGLSIIVFSKEVFPRITLLLAFISLSVLFLLRFNSSWQTAGNLQGKLDKSFRWWGSKRVYILNLPDSYRGAYLYRNLQESAFKGNFVKYDSSASETEIVEILGYNLENEKDSVIIEKIGNEDLKVTLSKWGIWWWRKTLGATDYETDLIKVDVDEYTHSYIVHFKQRRFGDVFVYQANGEWCEINPF